MIQWNKETLTEINSVKTILEKCETEWVNRGKLYERFRRKPTDSELVSTDDEEMKIALESYITTMITGFFAGKEPIYDVEEILDTEKQGIIKKLLNKVLNNNNPKELKVLIDYISKYNDDGTEFWELAFDYFCMRACYEIIYENENNEIVYARSSPLNTRAIYDYSTPVNLIGLIRKWTETDKEGKEFQVIELTTEEGKFYFNKKNKEIEEDKGKFEGRDWGDIPAIAIENEHGLNCFELVISDVCAYERSLQNSRNAFKYNDEAKLGISGYQAENLMIIEDEKGNFIENPKRIAEDEAILKSRVMYFSDQGGAKWIEKNIQDTALQNHKKTLMDIVAMITGVINTTDLGFTNADNASALDRKFFPLEQMITIADKQFKKQFLRRWEVIIGRINKKKKKNYDFRSIKIGLKRNLPTDKDTETNRALKLRGLLSDESVIDMLPDELDSTSELKKIQKQESNTLENITNIIDTQNKDIVQEGAVNEQ